jgi:hypothetical protein
VSIAGYGATADGADDGGRKRGGTTVLAGTDGGELLLFDPAVNACSGDSGGPATVAAGDGGAALVAVVRAVDPTCVGGRTRAIPVGAARDWLEVVAPEVEWGTWAPPPVSPSSDGCGGGGAAAVLGTVALRWKRRTSRSVARRKPS